MTILEGFLDVSANQKLDKTWKLVAVTRGVLDDHHRYGRIEYLGDVNVPEDGSNIYIQVPVEPWNKVE